MLARNRGTKSRTASVFIKMADTAANGNWADIRLPPEIQKRRVAAVIERELTPLQREILLAHLAGRTQAEIAAERGVNRSSVCRVVHRAVDRLQRYLRY